MHSANEIEKECGYLCIQVRGIVDISNVHCGTDDTIMSMLLNRSEYAHNSFIAVKNKLYSNKNLVIFTIQELSRTL